MVIGAPANVNATNPDACKALSDAGAFERVLPLQPVASTRRMIVTNVRAHGLMTMNHDAMIGPCGPRPRPPAGAVAARRAGAGAGPRSGWNRYTLCVFGSTADRLRAGEGGDGRDDRVPVGRILVDDRDVALVRRSE